MTGVRWARAPRGLDHVGSVRWALRGAILLTTMRDSAREEPSGNAEDGGPMLSLISSSSTTLAASYTPELAARAQPDLERRQLHV